jgi:hypothetical protein
MDSNVNCVRLDCNHVVCYGCWAEWCSQQDDNERSQGNEDAENASAENM